LTAAIDIMPQIAMKKLLCSSGLAVYMVE